MNNSLFKKKIKGQFEVGAETDYGIVIKREVMLQFETVEVTFESDGLNPETSISLMLHGDNLVEM